MTFGIFDKVLTIEKSCQSKWPIFGFFPYFLSISLNFWLKCYTWFESSGNEDSDAIFPKSLGGTNKRADFCDGGGKVV